MDKEKKDLLCKEIAKKNKVMDKVVNKSGFESFSKDLENALNKNKGKLLNEIFDK